jgi:hypothetical protein
VGDIVLLVFCLLASGYVFWETGTYPPPPDISLDSGLYPRFLVYVLLFLAGLLAVGIIRKPAHAGRFSLKSPPHSLSALMAVCMVVYCGLLYLVGYALATVAFVCAATLLFRGTIKEGLLIGGGVTLFLEILFRAAFKVPLPSGMLYLF